jgi:hypothetical protein
MNPIRARLHRSPTIRFGKNTHRQSGPKNAPLTGDLGLVDIHRRKVVGRTALPQSLQFGCGVAAVEASAATPKRKTRSLEGKTRSHPKPPRCVGSRGDRCL